VLYGYQRRELRKQLRSCSQQLAEYCQRRRLPERVELGSDKAEIAGLVTAVQ